MELQQRVIELEKRIQTVDEKVKSHISQREEYFWMNEKFISEHTEQKNKIDKIFTAIVGDDMGNHGLMKRVQKLEEYIEKDSKIKNRIRGILIVVGILWTITLGIFMAYVNNHI